MSENASTLSMKREDNSTDDFEHLEHELQREHQQPLLDISNSPQKMKSNNFPMDNQDMMSMNEANLLDTSVPSSILNNGDSAELKPVPATPPPSADSAEFNTNSTNQDDLLASIRDHLSDPKTASMAFMESEKNSYAHHDHDDLEQYDSEDENTEPERSEPSQTRPAPVVSSFKNNPPTAQKNNLNLLDDDDDDLLARDELPPPVKEPPKTLFDNDKNDFMGEIRSSTLPQPEKSPELDFVKDEMIVQEERREKPPPDNEWNVLDDFEHSKPLPPLPKDVNLDEDNSESFDVPQKFNKYQMDNDFLSAEIKDKSAGMSGGETDEFESEAEPSPAKAAPKSQSAETTHTSSSFDKSTAEEFFRNFQPYAWFNPERLHPKVAALIYWRDVKKSGIVFGTTLGVLLSLAYFSLISVLAYSSLLTLTYTVLFRIYKTVLQAIQKTSDGHPFQEILDLDLTLPSNKVHEVADIAVANINGAVSELRRLFLVEDFVDSLKFGILLWSLTYLGSWFNGMTLIIIGVVALFTLPKVYETNKTQIDQQLAMIQSKISEVTTKVKAALPIGKKEAKQE